MGFGVTPLGFIVVNVLDVLWCEGSGCDFEGLEGIRRLWTATPACC